MLVVLGHAREILFRAQGLPVTGSGLGRLWLLPTSLAQESVAIFFVLSGYLVGGQVLRQVRAGTFLWRFYLAKRLSRLWTVLLQGIAFTFALDSITFHWFPVGFTALVGHSGTGPVATALCNSLFLQRARCSTFGSNDSLWSLSYEFWFYISFAAAAVALSARTTSGLRRLVSAVVLIAALSLFGIGLLYLFPAWLFGVALAVLQTRTTTAASSTRGASLSVRGCTGLLAAALILSNVWGPSDPTRFILVGLAASPAIYALAVRDPLPGDRRLRRIYESCAALGPWSYSLYVFHLPLLVLVASMLSKRPDQNGSLSALAVYGLASLTIVLVYPLGRLTEGCTPRVRMMALRALG